MLSESERQQVDLLFACANSGDPAVEDAAASELERWASSDEARVRYLQRLLRTESFLGTEAQALQARLAAGSLRVRSRSRAASTWAGAVASVLLVLALWWWNPVLDRYQGATAVGERRVVELADGSRVTLNTNTRFAATMRLRSRETVLEQGEALFEVAPSAWRPFHTLAGEANIRVVGTIYDVRVDAGGTRVSVVEGRVEVWTPGRQTPFDLAAGTALDTAGAQVARVPAADLKALTAWRDGKLVFDERPVAEVLAEAGRYRPAPIRLADAAAGQPRISGVFSTDNVDALLRMLPEVAAVEVSFGADGEAVVASRRVAADGPFTAPVPIDPKIR